MKSGLEALHSADGLGVRIGCSTSLAEWPDWGDTEIVDEEMLRR